MLSSYYYVFEHNTCEMIRGITPRTTHSICTCRCRDGASTTDGAALPLPLPLSVFTQPAAGLPKFLQIESSRFEAYVVPQVMESGPIRKECYILTRETR